MKWRVFTAIALVAACACASNPASKAVPLEIPDPPPRVAMDPVPAVIDEPPEEKPVPAVQTLPRPVTNTPPATPAASVAPPSTTPPVVLGPEPVKPAPPPELRPASAAGKTPNPGQVRESLARTKQKLDAIDRRRLNPGQRADYDSARRFLSAASTALNSNNLLLAESSVDKAETLADGLK